MTKEEAIKILNGYMCGKIDPESTELYQAIELVVDILESKPSLPSNLDEAAENYTDSSEWLIGENLEHIEAAFKAGAEWMAVQGVTKEAVIGMATEEISINVSQQTLDKLELYPGDKVVVQIRKK